MSASSGESNSDKDDRHHSTRQVRVAILFVLYGMFGFISSAMVFGEYVFNVDLCKILNENYKCEFETELSKYGDIFNIYYSPTYSTLIHCATPCSFINSGQQLREQLVLKDLFDVVYGKHELNNVCGCGFNENFYENGYCYPPVAPAPIPKIMIILNDTGFGIPRIDTGLFENDILTGIYGVFWDKNNIINGISSARGGAVASEGEPVGGQVEGAGREKFGALAQARSIEIGTVLITVLTIIVAIDICYLFNDLRIELHSDSNSSTNNRTRSSICSRI